MDDVLTIAVFCIVSGILSAIICVYAAPLGRATRLVDHPDGKLKLHSGETPLIGGLAVFLPSLGLSLVYFAKFASPSFMEVALGAGALMFAIGIVDDRIGLSPRARLAALALIVLAVFALDPLFILRTLRFGLRSWDFGVTLGMLAVPVTALMIIGFVNAVNMADGINGQFLGSVTIWSLFVARYLGIEFGAPYYIIFCSAMVTLAFNLKGRLFSGSSGAYTASFLIGLGTIAAYRRGGALSAIEPILWFWLPVLDCVRLMATRKLAGKSPFRGDRNHIHHILQAYFGIGSPWVLASYLGLLAAPGLAAALMNDRLSGTVTLIACIAGYAALVYARPSIDAALCAENASPVQRQASAGPALRVPEEVLAARQAEQRKLTTLGSN